MTIRLVALLLLVACTSPTEPSCVHLLMAAPGFALPIDSLEAEGWVVLQGDTLAVLDVECPEDVG